MYLIIIKIISLAIAILYGFSNIVRAFRGQKISSLQMLLMTIGIVGFIVIQFKLYL